jgi:hypothetical protein
VLAHETDVAEAENVAPEVKARFIDIWPEAENRTGTSDIDVPFTTSAPSEIAPEQPEDGAGHEARENTNSTG